MAARFYGINVGQSSWEVSSAATTQTKDIEVQIDLDKVTAEVDVKKALDNILAAIMRGTWPPA